MAKYLDSTGLTYLWGKIAAAFQAKVTASGLLKGDGSGGVTAATSGTDYQAPLTAGVDYQTPLTNPVTGTGTSGYLAKFNGGTTVTNGPALGSATTTFLRNDGSWATPSNTTYSAGTGLSLSSTTFNHESSITAGTAGTSSATSGSTLAVPYVTYNATGHVTAAGTHTHTITGFLTSYTETDPKINRSTYVNAADTNYTTLMARGEALYSADTNPGVNGAICWTYG